MQMNISLRLGTPLKSSGDAAFNPASLFTGGEEGVALDTANSFTDTAGTTAATTGDDIARINDLSGNGNHVTQAVVAERPELTASGSMDFDGVDDNLTLLSSGLGSDMTAVFALKTTDDNFIILNDSANTDHIGPTAANGFASTVITNDAGTPSITIGSTTSFATRADIHTAAATGQWVKVLIESLDATTSSWSDISFGEYSAPFSYDGELSSRILLIDRDLTESEKADVEAWIMEGLT